MARVGLRWRPAALRLMRMESSEAIIWGRGCQRAQARAAHLLPLRGLLPLVDKAMPFGQKLRDAPILPP
jgi:hypothetical protein